MYIKKSVNEIIAERAERKRKASYFVFLLALSIAAIIFYGSVPVDAFMELSVGQVFYTFFFLISGFSIYRGYVLYGTFYWTTGRRCLECHRSWTHSNDGWGFMSFGGQERKWYQIEVCSNAGTCEIVRDDEVKWIPDINQDRDEITEEKYYLKVSWKKFTATNLDIHAIRQIDDYYKELPLVEARKKLKRSGGNTPGPFRSSNR